MGLRRGAQQVRRWSCSRQGSQQHQQQNQQTMAGPNSEAASAKTARRQQGALGARKRVGCSAAADCAKEAIGDATDTAPAPFYRAVCRDPCMHKSTFLGALSAITWVHESSSQWRLQERSILPTQAQLANHRRCLWLPLSFTEELCTFCAKTQWEATWQSCHKVPKGKKAAFSLVISCYYY